ncbi:hypothetical protein L218DRAFT_948402 [Marasmius fiardii PR-910]|nr:hypothetical protein L218DRAFT_948402 [Marasmius fiardii PR-910]
MYEMTELRNVRFLGSRLGFATEVVLNDPMGCEPEHVLKKNGGESAMTFGTRRVYIEVGDTSAGDYATYKYNFVNEFRSRMGKKLRVGLGFTQNPSTNRGRQARFFTSLIIRSPSARLSTSDSARLTGYPTYLKKFFAKSNRKGRRTPPHPDRRGIHWQLGSPKLLDKRGSVWVLRPWGI